MTSSIFDTLIRFTFNPWHLGSQTSNNPPLSTEEFNTIVSNRRKVNGAKDFFQNLSSQIKEQNLVLSQKGGIFIKTVRQYTILKKATHPNQKVIHEAAQCIPALIPDELDEFDCLLDFKNDNNQTLLHCFAIFSSHKILSDLNLLMAHFFRKQPEFIDAQDKDGRTALHLAVLENNLNLIKCLLTHGANPNIFDHQHHVPLHYAVAIVHTDMINLLYDKTSDPKGTKILFTCLSTRIFIRTTIRIIR